MWAEVANIGSRPAYEVSIVSEPPLVRYEDQKEGGVPCAFTTNVIHFLAPGRVISDSFGASHQFLSANVDKVFRIRATYKDSEDNRYEEASNLSAEFYRERYYSHPVNPPNRARSM